MPSQTSQDTVFIIQSIGNNASVVFLDDNDLRNAVLMNLQNSGFTNEEQNTVNAVMEAAKTGQEYYFSDPQTALKAMAAGLYFGLNEAHLSQYKGVKNLFIDVVKTEAFGSVKLGDAIGNYANTSIQVSPRIEPSKVPTLGKALGVAGIGVSVGAGILDILNSSNPELAGIKQGMVIGTGITVTALAAPALVPVLLGSTLAATGVAVVLGGVAGLAVEFVWDNAQTIADDVQQGILTAAEGAAQIADLVTDKFNELWDSTGQEAQDALDQAKVFGDDILDGLKGIADDFDWALDNPELIYPELPQWMQDVAGKFFEGVAELPPSPYSPLVLDLDGDGIELTDVNGPGAVYFDLDNDGFAERAGWVTGGDGLLVLDRNGNGTIDAQNELFGDTATAANGFENLKTLDSNGDNKFTAADAQWNDLRVWVDANADGVSQAAELTTLSGLGISSINLAYSEVLYDLAGNQIRQEGTFVQNGTTRPVVDAWFAYDRIDSEYVGDYTLDVRTLFLPTLRGYGDVKDLHIAMSEDETLLNMVTVLATATVADISDPTFDYKGKMQAMIERWAGVDALPTTGNVDFNFRNFAEMKKFVGTEILNYYIPNFSYTDPLKLSMKQLTDSITARFMSQTSAFADQGFAYNPLSDQFEDGMNVISLIASSAGGTLSAGTVGSTNHVLMFGQGGNDTFFGGAGNDRLYGADGNDRLYGDDGNDWLYGGAGTDDLIGGAGNDVLNGGAGNDNLLGDEGDDFLFGNEGNDGLFGSAGDDTLNGGIGTDNLWGAAGNDTYVFAVGDSPIATPDSVNVVQGEGLDTIKLIGVLPQDVQMFQDQSMLGLLHLRYSVTDEILIYGWERTSPTTTISSADYTISKIAFDNGTVWDFTAGWVINDTDDSHWIRGTIFSDILNGHGGNDTIYGGSGSDTLSGGDGNDVITGSDNMFDADDGIADHDTIDGGKGADQLRGSWGDDTYVFRPGDSLISAPDQISEIVNQGTDTIRLTGGILPSSVTFTKLSSNYYYSLKFGTDEIQIVNYTINGNTITSTNTLAVEKLVFDNGTELNLSSIINAPPPPPNTNPVAKDDNFTGNEDTVITGNVLNNNGNGVDSDANGNTLSVEVITGLTTAQGGSVNILANGNFTYTPAANFNGLDSFTYTLQDGQGGSDTGTVSLTINAVNDDPTAKDDDFTGNQDEVVNGNVLADNGNGVDSDIDGDPLNILAVTGLTTTQGGSVNILENGSFIYNPANGFFGSDSFSYTLEDGQGGSDTGIVSLTINQVTPPPSSNVIADEDFEGGASGWSNNQTDNTEAAILTEFLGRFAQSTGTVSKSFALSGDQSALTVAFDFYKIDSWDNEAFNIYIDGNQILSQNFQINPSGDGSGSFAGGTWERTQVQAGEIVFGTINQWFVDAVYHYELTFDNTNTSLQLGFSGSLNSDANDESWGIDNLVITADGTATGNLDPVAKDDNFTGLQDVAVTGNVLADNGNGVDSDINGDPLNVVAVTSLATAQGGSVDILFDGSFTYTPASSFTGADNFSYTLEDGQGGSDTGTVNLTVNPLGAPSAGLQASYYVLSSSPSVISGIDFNAAPDVTEIVTSIDQSTSGSFFMGGPSNNFAAKYEGYLNVVQAGDYTLKMTSDDGSALWIDGAQVINNDGLHGARSISTTLSLSAGLHALQAQYFEAGGDAVMKLYWNGPDSGHQEVLVSGGALSHGAAVNHDPVAQDDNFTGLQDVVVTGNVLADNGNGVDSDIDGDPLNVVAVAGIATAQGGSVDILTDGSFTYTPGTGFTGADSFSYTLQDGQGGSDVGTVNLTINAPGTSTIITNEDFEGGAVGWSNNQTDNAESASFTEFLGRFGNSTSVSKTYALSGDQTQLTVAFDFYKIDSWDYEPFKILLDGAVVYNENFGITPAGNGSGTFTGGSWTRTQMDTGHLGFGNDHGYWVDAVYHYELTFDNSNTSLELGFGGNLNESVPNESFGIDNLVITTNGSAPGEQLYGTSGADVFAWLLEDVGSAIDVVHEFNTGQGDALDVSDILTGYDPLADLIADFVQITDNGTNSFLAVDADGGADNFVQIATLANVTGLTNEDALEAAGNLVGV